MVLVNRITSDFEARFQTEPIMVFSPGRINLIGEHTDYNEGFVFPAAIDKGIYVAMSKSNTDHCLVHALDMMESLEFSVTDPKSFESGSWKNYIIGVVAEIQNAGKTIEGFNVVFSGDIPVGSGLSSSAALENGIVFGLNSLFDLKLSKKKMILISQKAEHNYVGVKCGIMDQFASMFGQKDKALLLDCRTLESEPFDIDFNDYRLLLINSNVKHNLSSSAYNDRRKVCETTANLLGIKALRDASERDIFTLKSKITDEDFQKVLYVVQENERVKKAADALRHKDLLNLGTLLFETHQGLKYQYKVSCDELDFLVDRALTTSGVIGSRMMGGGFGGCTINIVHKETINSFSSDTSMSYQKQFGVHCSFYNVTLGNGTHLVSL